MISRQDSLNLSLNTRIHYESKLKNYTSKEVIPPGSLRYYPNYNNDHNYSKY